MKRIWSVGTAILILCTVLCGCANTAAQDNRQSMSVVMSVTGDEYHAQAVEAAQNEAQRLAQQQGFELEIHTALNAQEQKQQLNEAVAEQPGVLVLWPFNQEVTELAVPSASQNGTELVLYQPCPQEGAVTYSAADQRIGELTARYINRYFSDVSEEEKVCVLEVSDTANTVSELRTEGLHSLLDQNIAVVGQIETDGSSQDTRSKLEEYLHTTSPEQLQTIHAIVCQSDLICMNVLSVLEQTDTPCKPQLVTGVGGDRELAMQIQDHPIDIVTYSYSPKMLADVVRLGVKVMNGEVVRQHYTEPIIEVDKYTVDAYIQSDNYQRRYGLE